MQSSRFCQQQNFHLILHFIKHLVYKILSQISSRVFFSLEKLLFIWKCWTEMTSLWTKVLISPVWNKIFKIWDAIFQVDANRCSKCYFIIFLWCKIGASEKNIDLEQEKTTPKISNNNKEIFLRIFDLSRIQSKLQVFSNTSWICIILAQTFWL